MRNPKSKSFNTESTEKGHRGHGEFCGCMGFYGEFAALNILSRLANGE